MRNSLTGQHIQQQNKSRLNIGFDPAEKGADKSVFMRAPKQVNNAISQQLVCKIIVLAMKNNESLNIEVAYLAEFNELSVKVIEDNENYKFGVRRKYAKGISLSQPNAVEELHDLESKLEQLIADAKDKAMGAV